MGGSVQPRVMYVGIDFGTSRSGFGSYYGPPDGPSPALDMLKINVRYPAALRPYCKTPTALLYKRGSWTVEAWGWEALYRYSKLKLIEQPEYLFLDRFKLLLAPPGTAHGVELPPALTADQVISDYLRCLKDYALKQINLGSEVHHSSSSIQWALTVPANWTDAAKATMRSAAATAGIVSSVDSANLLLLHEPEAAAAAATRDYSLQLLPGEKLMIIDAGGGTVDMTLHSVAASSSGDGQPVLKGVVARQGLMAGASFLDKMFMNWARCELGSAQWDAWIEHAPRDYNKFLYKTWEDQKFAFGALDPLCEAELDLPQSLVRELSEETIDSKLQDGYQLIVPAVVMESFFAGLISQMLGKAQGMIREAGGSVDHVLLAGGFAESPYLVQQLRAGLAGLISGSLVVPSYAGSAVVKGATLYACRPAVVASRRSAYTYGIIIRDAFDPKRHPERLKFWDDECQMYRADKVLQTWVSKGQEVMHDMAPITGSLCATKAACISGRQWLSIYQCDNISSKFTDQPGMKMVAEAYLIVPPGMADKPQAERMFHYTVHIDGVELVMRAKWKASGEAVEVRTSFRAG